MPFADVQFFRELFDDYVNQFSEVIELMTGMVGCLYIRLNAEAYLEAGRTPAARSC